MLGYGFQHPKMYLRACRLLDLGCYVTRVLCQQRLPLGLDLPTVKSTGGIDNVEQALSVLEFVAKLFIALVEVKGVPVLALPVEIKADCCKLGGDKRDCARMQRGYTGSEVGRDFTIVGSMRQLSLDDNGVGQQQCGDCGCPRPPPAPPR